MPRFPKREAEVVALAERLWRGLLDNNAVFPHPPVHPILIRIRKLIYRSRHGNFLAASAAAEAATTAKDEKLADLIDAMKPDLRYAENVTKFNDDKLKLIGWSGKKAKTPLAVPGQPRLLEAPKQGAGSFSIGKHPPTAENPKPTKSSAAIVPQVAGKQSPQRYSLKSHSLTSRKKPNSNIGL